MTDVILVILCILVIAQIVYKYISSAEDRAILRRVEALLTATETHSRLNQENKERLAQTLATMKAETTIAAKKAEGIAQDAKEEIKATVEQVPDKVVEKIHGSGQDSTTHLRTYKPDIE